MGTSHTKRKFISCNNSCLKFFEDQVNLRLVINEYFKIRTCTISWKQCYQNRREIDHIRFEAYRKFFIKESMVETTHKKYIFQC